MSESANSQNTLTGEAISDTSNTPLGGDSDAEGDVDKQQSLAETAGVTAAESPVEDSSAHGSPSEDDDGEESESSESDESLERFGVDDDPRPNNAKLDNPDGELDQDRRVNVKNADDENKVEQRKLFPDVDDQQMTLGGENAASQCLFDQ